MIARILILSCSFAALACSSDPSAGSACADLAHARCSHLESCSATVVQIRYGDEATCETREKQNCTNALAAPGTGNSPSRSEDCSAAIAGWSCADFMNGANIPAACVQATGSVASGAACAFPGQCQTGFCAIAPGSACGTCAAAPAAGTSCAALTTCGQGTLVCTADTQTCVALATTVGASCGKGAPCGAGLQCVGANAASNTPGTCQTAATQLGATCDPQQQTGPGCDRAAGLVCNRKTKQCATAVVAAAGEACGDVNNQPTFCAANATCTGSSAGQAGTCTAAAADGAACDTANGPDCEQQARCIVASGSTAGTCRPNDATMCM
jgi:hypothetical protein